MNPPQATTTLRRLILSIGQLRGQPHLCSLIKGLRVQIDFQPSLKMPKAPKYFAVSKGRKTGIYESWAEAEQQVKGFSGARYKRFESEAAAKEFILSSPSAPYPQTSSSSASSQRVKGSKNAGDIAITAAGQSHCSPSPPLSPLKLPSNLRHLANRGYAFSRTEPHYLVVYTDGSSLGNGKRGAKAGLGVWWGHEGEAASHNLSERVPGSAQTNNRGELLSIIRALETCPYPNLPLEVRTDSQYAISCMTIFLPRWISNGFRVSNKGGPHASKSGGEMVKNVDLIKHLLCLIRLRGLIRVKFKYVRGHVGHEGNEAADKLARAGALRNSLPERTDWLDPENEGDMLGILSSEKPTDVEVDIDPTWLMTETEMADLEKQLASSV